MDKSKAEPELEPAPMEVISMEVISKLEYYQKELHQTRQLCDQLRVMIMIKDNQIKHLLKQLQEME